MAARDGGVHQLCFPRCRAVTTRHPELLDLRQPDFDRRADARDNVAFRIPLQLSGLGLIESIQDREILAHIAAIARPTRPWASPAIPIAAATTAPSPASAGRRRTSRSRSSPARPTTSKRASPTRSSRSDARKSELPGPEQAGAERHHTDATHDADNQGFRNPLHELPDWHAVRVMMRFTDAPQPDPPPGRKRAARCQAVLQIGCSLCHTPP